MWRILNIERLYKDMDGRVVRPFEFCYSIVSPLADRRHQLFLCGYPPIRNTRPRVQGFSGAFYNFPLMRLFSINPLADTDPVIAIIDHFVERVLPYKEMPGRAPDHTGVVGTPRFKVSCQKDKNEARRERRAEFNSAPTSGSKRLDLVVGGI